MFDRRDNDLWLAPRGTGLADRSRISEKRKIDTLGTGRGKDDFRGHAAKHQADVIPSIFDPLLSSSAEPMRMAWESEHFILERNDGLTHRASHGSGGIVVEVDRTHAWKLSSGCASANGRILRKWKRPILHSVQHALLGQIELHRSNGDVPRGQGVDIGGMRCVFGARIARRPVIVASLGVLPFDVTQTIAPKSERYNMDLRHRAATKAFDGGSGMLILNNSADLTE